MKCYLIVALICNYLRTAYVEHFFPYINWPFVYLLRKSICSDTLITIWIICVFWYSYKCSIYSRYVPYQIIMHQNFLRFCGQSLHFHDCMIWSTKAFNFVIVPFIYFSLIACTFGVITKKQLPNPRSERFTPLFLRVL